MHAITWFVIANSVEALIYKIENLSFFEEKTYSPDVVKHFLHEKGRLSSSELLHDHQFSQRNDAHEREHALFAKTVADFLEEGRKESAYHSLILCAEPHFYGLLKNSLSENTIHLIKKHVLKDYIPLNIEGRTEVIHQTLMG